MDEENLKKKKMGLTYLHYYHKNYNDASVEEQRKIRHYYDNTLRYKSAFYRDRKTFDKFGHPSKWTETKINRFTIHPDKQTFDRGTKIFVSKPFVMYSPKLIEINISKLLDMELVKIIDGYYVINLDFPKQVRKEIKALKGLIKTFDNQKGIIKVKLKFQETLYNLENVQIVFKLQINTAVQYISTRFQHPRLLEENAINRLNTFLRTITNIERNLEEGSTLGLTPSNKDYVDMDITKITLLGIVINKLTNLDHRIRDDQSGSYAISSRALKTRTVMNYE